jgi:hypothetical protein
MPLKFYNRKNKAKWVLKMDAGLVGECVLGFSALPGFASGRWPVHRVFSVIFGGGALWFARGR